MGKKDIIKDIQKVSEDVEGYLSFSKYKVYGEYANEIMKQFGSWSNAKTEAGLPTRKKGKVESIPPEKLAEMV